MLEKQDVQELWSLVVHAAPSTLPASQPVLTGLCAVADLP